MRSKKPKQQRKIKRIQGSSLINNTIFLDLYNKPVYFLDADLKSKNYFKLGFDTDMIFTAGKNLIRIKGTPGMLAPSSQLLIEAVDITGLPLKTSIYDLKNETNDKVICVEVHEATPAGDVKLTLVGSAIRLPDGKGVPPYWQNELNFKWTQTFEARPFSPNKSDILFNEETTPSIAVEEIIRPYNHLIYNQELITSIGGQTSTNVRSNYRLSTHGNTRSKVSYRKSGGHYFITAHAFDGNILDFGGFTADMVGGILIVAEPQNPRPRSVAGYEEPEVFSPKERGDDFKITFFSSSIATGSISSSTSTCYADEDTDGAWTEEYIQGAYQTTVLEFISPFEIRVKDPHTTWQGLNEDTHRLFEHTQFDASAYRLIWNQKPQKCDPTPLDELDVPMKNSFAHVKFTNLTPASGDVTRIKSYTRNNQSPADWVLASDMPVTAKEMLYCKNIETCKVPAGDFSRWGVGADGITSVLPYWDAEGIGFAGTGSLNDPPLALYYQQGADDAPPTPDSLIVGNNSGSNNLTGDKHWILYSKLFPEFRKGKMYQLEISSVSSKTQVTTWLPEDGPLEDPNIEIYMSGSSFIDDVNDNYNYGKYVGNIETAADKEKHVDQDRYNKDLTRGYKFIFTADDDGTGKPLIKINSGVWQFWNISLKPLDLFGFTPEEFEITFPTTKCDIEKPEAIDFKFEFYNDYGTIANYTAELNNLHWENKHTAIFDNIITSRLYADFLISTSSIINLEPVTFSSGIHVEGNTSFGDATCTQSLILKGNVDFPCLNVSDNRIVTYDINSGRISYSDTMSSAVGSGTASAVQHTWMTVRADDLSTVSATGLNDILDIEGDQKLIQTTTVGGDFRIAQHDTPTFINPVTASNGLWSPTSSVLSGSTTIHGETIQIGTCCTDDVTIRGDIKMRCLDYWDNPTYVLSYDHPTRTVYYSDPSTGGGEGGCGTAFTKIGYDTNTNWSEGGTIDIFTASSCNDIFYILPGDGITFTTYSAGVSGSDDGIVIHTSRQDNAWSFIHTDTGSGNILNHDEHLYITGSGGIVVRAGYSSSNVVVEIDGSGISGSGGTGSGDNLGNHTATQDLEMHDNWVRSEDEFGMMWTGSGATSRTSSIFQNGSGGVSKEFLEVSSSNYRQIWGNSVSGTAVYTGTTMLNRLSTSGGVTSWYTPDLAFNDTDKILSYDPATGQIFYKNDDGGAQPDEGEAHGCCSNCKDFGQTYGLEYAVTNRGAEYSPDTTNHFGCPTTIGGNLLLQELYEFNAEDYSKTYSPKAWFQVNNWSGPYDDDTYNVGYAAVFNSTAPPFTMHEGGNPHTDQQRAGHGIRIMTSTIPINWTYTTKDKVGNSCNGITELEPMGNESGGSSGLPNAYYIDFHHQQFDTNTNTSHRTFAGGIRKDCQNFENSIVIEYSSDRRLKENIECTATGIDTLMDIQVRDFDYIATPESHRVHKTTGFIAQELQEVYPQAAFGNESKDPKESPMTVAPDRLIPLLIKSVQDQQDIITKLETRIKKLEKSNG